MNNKGYEKGYTIRLKNLQSEDWFNNNNITHFWVRTRYDNQTGGWEDKLGGSSLSPGDAYSFKLPKGFYDFCAERLIGIGYSSWINKYIYENIDFLVTEKSKWKNSCYP